MSTGPLFRFVDPSTLALRLELRNNTGWYLGQGLDLGGRPKTYKWLTQAGVEGAELAAVWNGGVVMMQVPLILMPQASAGAIEDLIDDLNTELARTTNAIEYLPHGLTGNSWIIDTFAANEISIQDGQPLYSQWLRRDGIMYVLNIPRLPSFRQRSTGVA